MSFSLLMKLNVPTPYLPVVSGGFVIACLEILISVIFHEIIYY
jgi:hypothetical protein